MSQYADLKAQIAKLQAQAEEARRTEIDNVVADIRQKIAEYGLTAQDLGFAVGEISGPEIRKHMERARQTTQVDCRQESRAFSDWCGVIRRQTLAKAN
jgi:DNA-binding protein H-NS